MRWALLAASLAAMAGCSKPLTNEQLMETYRLCSASGMEAHALKNYDDEIIELQCVPPQHK